MLETLMNWDVGLLRAANLGWASPAADAFFVFITHLSNFVAPLVLLGAWWVLKGGRRGRFLVAALVLNVALTDQLSSHAIKPLVGRARPCQTFSDIRTPDGCGPARSFPSSHASNIAGAMTLVALTYPAWTILAVLAALAVGLSRVYLGLHYPSDILGGFLLGFLCALAVWRLKRWAEERWFAKAPSGRKKARRRKRNVR